MFIDYTACCRPIQRPRPGLMGIVRCTKTMEAEKMRENDLLGE